MTLSAESDGFSSLYLIIISDVGNSENLHLVELVEISQVSMKKFSTYLRKLDIYLPLSGIL